MGMRRLCTGYPRTESMLRVYTLNGGFVDVPHGNPESLMERVAKALGLKDSSRKYFTLVRGKSPEKPLSVITGHDEQPVGKSEIICVRKWCFDVSAETKLISTDDVAMNLVFQEAVHAVETGLLRPNDEQQAELDSFCNPSFPVEKQYIQLCQKLPEYNRVDINDCEIIERTKCSNQEIERGTRVSMHMTMRGIRLVDSRDGKCIDFTSWQYIRGWQFSFSRSLFSYEIALISPQMDHTFFWIPIRTDQVSYLLSVIQLIVKKIKRLQDGPESFLPRPLANQEKEKSGLRSFMNDLFSMGKSDDFSAI